MINKLIFRPPTYTGDKHGTKTLKLKNYAEIPIDYILIRPRSIKSSFVILYSHGNAEDINSCYKSLKKIANVLSINILIYDYPGYGSTRNLVKPSEEGCYRAIESIYSMLKHKYSFRTKHMILYGRSVGTGPTCHLAKTVAVGGIVLDSAFTSCAMVMTRGIDLLGEFDVFRNFNKVQHFESPTLVIHGTKDKLIPISHAELLYSRLKTHIRYHFSKLDCEHNEVSSAPGYLDELIDFVTFVVESAKHN